MIFCLKRADAWEDRGWVEESAEAEITSAALAGAQGRWLIAYLVRAPDGRFFCRLAAVPAEDPGPASSTWRRMPAYPQPPGVAGAMAGTHKGVLIVAGGANFPDRPPWDGGTKRYYDAIHVLLPGESTWRPAGRLPSPRAYGASVSTPRGVLIAGGEDGATVYSDSLLLAWDGRKVEVGAGPPLPEATASPAAFLVSGALYLAGGYTGGLPRLSRRSFWRLALDQPAAVWEPLEPWPGAARAMAVAAILDGDLYLVSGLDVQPVEEGRTRSVYLRDAYRYRPNSGWERLPDLPWSVVAAPSPAPVASPGRIFILGGVDGTQAGRVSREADLPNDILCYEAARSEWRLWTEASPTPVVTAPVAAWDGEWAVISGEIKPGVRTTDVWAWRA